MIRRSMGKLGRTTSVLMYGGAALGEVSQDVADASVQEALDAGIDHFDVAAGYGEAELRLGPWSTTFRERGTFLATKTDVRDAEGSWEQIQASLERMQVDRVDLLQVHAVGDLEDLDRVTGAGGALEAVLRARDEGLTEFVGITGHTHSAPATHLEALRRFPFDAVLTPWNHVLSTRPDYRRDFLDLVAESTRQDVALRTIKTVSRRNWEPGADPTYATWYEPWDDERHLEASVAFALRQEGVCALAAPGDIRLLGRVVTAVQRAEEMSDDDIEAVLSTAPGYSSPFERMPW